MKRIFLLLHAALALSVYSARAQSGVSERPLLYNDSVAPEHGLNWAPQPPQVLPNLPGAQPNQFRGAIVFGGITRRGIKDPLLTPGTFADNVDKGHLDWPRSEAAGEVKSILRAAVGGPYLNHGFDYLFGQEIVPPITDFAGVKLTPAQADFWHPVPVFRQVLGNGSVTNDPSKATDYYYSPHKQVVYATKAGQAAISWRTTRSTIATAPAGYNEGVTHVRIGAFYYPVTNSTVSVSGIPVKTPQTLYWTKGDYEKSGQLVAVPPGIHDVNFIYNNRIPESVPESEVVIGGNIRPNTAVAQETPNGNTTVFTSTVRAENGFISAYNREGRIFLELLGDATGPNTRQQLGIEIVEVLRDVVATDATIELGERVTAYPNNDPSDSALQPAPINQVGKNLVFKRSIHGDNEVELYATRVTGPGSEFEVHWLKPSIGGLAWPYRFVRYAFIWPTNAAAYSHYLRPQVADEAAAALTAIPLPGENAPVLEDQDPSNIGTARAKLTTGAFFYTYLDPSQPALRALLRYNVGDRVAFERVFSWLDVNLKATNIDNTVASSLGEVAAYQAARSRDVNGDWTLHIGKLLGAGVGKINSWSLVVETQPLSGEAIETEFPGAGFNIPAAGQVASVATVARVTGAVTAIRLKVNGFTFPNPAQLFMSLSNATTSLDIIRGVGGSTAVADVNLVFDDSAPAPVTTSLVPATYRPTGGTLSSLLSPVPAFAWADIATAPRVYNATAYVGERVDPPAGELGTLGDPYPGGYINQSVGTSFSASAYANPFEGGYEVAHRASIIPVNAIPGRNQLEVWWFRKHAPTALRDETLGFKPTYWPAVIGRYTLEWPSNPEPRNPPIVLASNHGSGPLNSFQSAGALYIQNDRGLPGYNPNEEHALLQGGRVWALRDDLNITNGVNYSSHPFVLLQYLDQDGRPSMTAFPVVRQTATEKFDYTMDAGLVLQAPMPLPLLEKPIAPTAPGELPRSLNAEVARRNVAGLEFPGDSTDISVTVSVTDRPLFLPYQTLILQHKLNGDRFWLYATNINLELNQLSGFLLNKSPIAFKTPATIVQPASLKRVRYAVKSVLGIPASGKAVVANPEAGMNWVVNITGTAPAVTTAGGLVTQDAFVEVEFPDVAGAEVDAQNDSDRAGATVLARELIAEGNLATETLQQFAAGWQVAYETLATVAAGLSQERQAQTEFYNQITFQDRKGNLWIYRGPHDADDQAMRQMQFYYKTLPGFWYPTDQAGNVLGTATGLNKQPEVGSVTPYLRPANLAGDGYLGDAVYGNRENKRDEDNHLVGDGNSLGIVYRARWPETAPVLQMAETLTVPKRGLPAVRGQTSMEVLYQQSLYTNGAAPSVVLHDPTAPKKFRLADTNPDGSSSGGLSKLPGSIQTSALRGKTFFPRLAPHLVDRFYFDPNDGKSGSLVFVGEFKQEVLGESYLLPNVISKNDIAALKALCAPDDAQKTDWNNAIDNAQGKPRLTAELETFYPNPAKPGTFTSTIEIGGQAVRQTVPIHANELVEVNHSDTAVDSYALTAVGPGTGYVTLIAGQGAAFTPPDEPVSVKIIKVADTLYRGEVKVILSSNPLAEKVTMQQVIDLAGKVESFDFEWWISAPVDGAPPPVYGNTATNLLFAGGEPWRHLQHPLATDTPSTFGTVGALANSPRVASDAATVVAPVSLIPFDGVTNAAGGILNFGLPATPAITLVEGNNVVVRDRNGTEVPARVTVVSNGVVSVVAATSDTLPPVADTRQLFERVMAGKPQSVLFRDFSVPATSTYSQYYLSLDLDDALGAKVYLDGALVATANLGEDDTATITPPSGFSPVPLGKVYGLLPASFASGTPSGANITHRIAVELFSGAIPGAALQFRCQLDAYESVDKVEALGSPWLKLDADRFPDMVRTILGEAADVRALSDNYVIMRYKAKADANFPAGSKTFSLWSDPALAEGWIKRVLAGINPFNQRTTDLFNHTVSTDASILASAGKRWEGDVALNLDTINDYGLIEIYETVLRRGKDLSINAGISYDPANDALLLAAGYLNDLYMMVGNEARADAANPTIGIGTKDKTYGDIATALFAFKGQLPTVLEEELALLRGRDDFLQPGTQLAPVYNRLVWNYTRGIDSGEVIYALNYNILDQNFDGKVDAADAAKLYPQGHGDAYGHYLTAMKGYYSLLIDKDFTWVPHSEAVNILGKAVAVDYQDERKFAAAAAAIARTGRQVFDLTWRKDSQSGMEAGWAKFSETRDNIAQTPPTHRQWALDHWAARTGFGAYVNWAMGNSILPPVDPDPTHEGIQKVDRTTVPELREIAITAADLQTAMDNAEARMTPLGLASGGLAFDLNPNQVAGADPKAHFEQIYDRALAALNNAVAGFDDAKDVTRLMRSEQDSLADLQAAVIKQEQAYTNSLIELYGTPYPDDVGPGKLYRHGYTGPDLYHYMYVETETIEAPGVYTPNEPDYVAKIDIQQLAGSWTYLSNLPHTNVNTQGLPDGSSNDLVIVNANDPLYQTIDPATGKPMYYIPYAFGSHGFFDKPAAWTSRRQSPGRIQQAISELIQAHDRMYYALAAQCESDKQDLDKAVQVFLSLQNAYSTGGAIRGEEESDIAAKKQMAELETGFAITDKVLENLGGLAADTLQFIEAAIPNSMIFGVAAGGDVVGPAPRTALYLTAFNVKQVLDGLRTAGFMATKISSLAEYKNSLDDGQNGLDAERAEEMKAAVFELGNRLKAVQGDFQVINEKLRIFDDTKRKYAALVAEGERLQQEREIFRQRSAAIVQGFRTRDAAFRIFRNEKLERYKTLFDLAARYAYLAANAYDYETGLLATTKGREFVSRLVSSRALGVVKDGRPQFAGSNTGDPGISSALAEMKADWDVLKGRLGFNNPTAYGTTFSLRTEKHRILPGAEGATAWKDVLNGARRANLLEDADVKHFCMQIDRGDGLPLPGLIIEFETTVADGYNFFGQTQQAWDHYFDSSSFATKIFAAGVALEGYVGMDNPVANSGAINGAGGSSPADPNLAFLDPNALGATPGIYLIPVGLDSMRSPALGDRGTIRNWSVDDVAIPLPFNIGASDLSSRAIYQSGDSLSEPLFETRKHASFRPVSTTAAFSSAIYGNNGSLQRSQFTNTRLIGRSVWNSKWKLVIPGSKLLHDPDEGLRRFINTVTDVKLHLVTYSYSGN